MGETGSGKSCLLNAIIGEMSKSDEYSKIIINGKISYVG